MSIERRLLELGDELRSEGVAIGTSELLDALAAVGEIDWRERTTFQAAISATLAKSPEDRRVFDLVFERFFFRAAEAAALEAGVAEAAVGGGGSDGAGRRDDCGRADYRVFAAMGTGGVAALGGGDDLCGGDGPGSGSESGAGDQDGAGVLPGRGDSCFGASSCSNLGRRFLSPGLSFRKTHHRVHRVRRERRCRECAAFDDAARMAAICGRTSCRAG